MAVGGETKIGSGLNFVDVRRGSTGLLEEEEADGGLKSAAIFVEDSRSPCFPIAHLCPLAQQGRFGVRRGSRLCFSFLSLRLSVMSVRTGPASAGCVAIRNIRGDSLESEEDTAEVHLHVNLSRHSQGLRRDATMKNKIQDLAQR